MKPFNPKSTVFTNLMLDIIMPSVTPNAWKIICYAMRKTAGWADLSTYSGRKESDIISLSQFAKGCGIKSENTVMEAINHCLEKKYLLREPDGQSYRYRLNTEYELTSSDIEIVNSLTSSEIEEVVTKTSSIIEDTNSKLINNNINTQEEQSTPAKKNGGGMNQEEIRKTNEQAMLKGLMSGSPYAHFPERIVPVVERMERLWYFHPPANSKKKNGKYAFWVQSCGEILEACAEFGVDILDELHADWMAYLTNHGGIAPYPISSPKSLVSAVEGKARLKRSGSSAPYWAQYKDKPVKQSTLSDLV